LRHLRKWRVRPLLSPLKSGQNGVLAVNVVQTEKTDFENRSAEIADSEEDCLALAGAVQTDENPDLVPGVGVEPKIENGDAIAPVSVPPKQEITHPLPSPLNSGHRGEDVARVVLAWAKLPEAIRKAIVALVEVGTAS